MTKLRMAGFLVLGAIVLTLCACASTKLVESWSDPQAGPIQFKKVIAFFIIGDESIRKAAEDELVRQMERTQGVASYTLIPESDLKDLDKLKGWVQREGFDGAVAMRLVGLEQKKSWVPGRYPGVYNNFYGYYGYARPFGYDPGYMVKDTNVSVETNVYSLTEDKLIWSGVSETFNPDSAAKLVDDVARLVAKDLKAKGLLQ